VGLACRSRANAPATCGVAMEVPVFSPYWFPGTADLMLVPGASSLI
jgi:hypothetical protein